MEIEFAPHLEEIKRALDNEIDEKSIIQELKKLLEYRVPISEAKRSLIKKYGGTEKSTVKKLEEISMGDRNIEVTGKILELSQREINIKNTERTIFSGIIADETAARSFTAWEDFDLNVGDVINVTGAYIRNWQDRPEVNFGSRSKVKKLETTIQLHREKDVRPLSELGDGEVNVHTVFTILNIETREINTKDGTKTILVGTAADKDTKLPLTSWVMLPELVPDNTFEVKNAYIRSYRGVPSLNINENSSVTRLDKTIKHIEGKRVMIGDVIDRPGAYDITIEGNIISVKSGSGLISRCPECSRVIQKSICRVHGKVDDVPDMRIKAIIDDGTGASMIVLDVELTQKLCSLTIEEAKQIAKTAMSQKAVEEEIKRKLLGKMIGARGNMSKSEFGVTFIADDVWESRKLNEEKVIGLLGRITG